MFHDHNDIKFKISRKTNPVYSRFFFVYKRWSLCKKSLFTISYLNPHQRLCHFVQNLEEFIFVSNVNHHSSHGKKIRVCIYRKILRWDKSTCHNAPQKKSLVDIDRTTMLFDIKQSSLGTTLPLNRRKEMFHQMGGKILLATLLKSQRGRILY